MGENDIVSTEGGAAADGLLTVEVGGIPVCVDVETFSNDMETLELLADIDEGNLFASVKLMRHLLGDDQYRNVKASLRKEGRTSVTDMVSFMGDLFEAIGGASKN